MKKKTLLFILALSACATNKTLYMNEYGQTVYKVDCGGWNNLDMSDCIKRAYEQCPLGFNILMADNSIKGYWSSYNNQGNINTNSYANIFGNSNTSLSYGNGYGYSNTNFQANGFGNSNTDFNSYGFGGASAQYSRYIIYTCKNPT